MTGWPARWAGLALALVVAGGASARAAAPSLDRFFPAGLARGTTNTVTALGKVEPWPPQVWVETPEVRFVALTNRGQFRVEVAPAAATGPWLVRLYSAEGISEPRIFVVGAAPELLESEPNNHFTNAMPVAALPATVNGRLMPAGDVDSYAVALAAGELLEARVDSHLLMSTIDPVLRLVTSTGQMLAWNHDGATLDPVLRWRSPIAQTVIVQVYGFAYPADSSVNLSGGEGAVYRLHLARDPVESRPATTDPGAPDAAVVSLPAERWCLVRGGQGPDGRVRVRLAGGESIEADVDAASLGLPLDTWLRIEDAAGKVLKEVDDAAGSLDPRLEWTAPSNGVYSVLAGSWFRRLGKDQPFRLAVSRPEPRYAVSLAESAFELMAGGTNTLKFTVTRSGGHTNRLAIEQAGLPPGVSVAATQVPSGSGAGECRLVAATNAAAFRGPVRLLVKDVVTGRESAGEFSLVSRSENNGVPGGFAHLLRESTTNLWFTVRPPAPPATPATPARK